MMRQAAGRLLVVVALAIALWDEPWWVWAIAATGALLVEPLRLWARRDPDA